MIENKYVQKAEDEFEYLTGDEAEKRLAELREKAIRDEAAALKGATRKGIEQGKLEVAKKMLTENCDIDLICKVTELTKEEIEKLQ